MATRNALAGTWSHTPEYTNLTRRYVDSTPRHVNSTLASPIYVTRNVKQVAGVHDFGQR